MKRFKRIPLEIAAEEVCIKNSKPPHVFQLPPDKGREMLNKAQDEPVCKLPANIIKTKVELGKYGKINLYYVYPEYTENTLNTILYIHGGGWVFGNFHTHDKLVRELAYRTNSVVIFPEYSLSPEAKYSIAIEQCYQVLNRLSKLLEDAGIKSNIEKLTVAGDSAGGNIATVLTILSKERNGPVIDKQLMYYPVTNAAFDTKSYIKFSKGYYLYREGMMWFFNQYTKSITKRNEIYISPLRASLEDLKGLPPALIIVGEADVLRDDGENYAIKLRKAGVDVTAVRFQAIIHDFVMLNSLDQTRACRGAMDLSTSWINRKNMLY